MREPTATIALLALPETAASTLYGMYDLFGATGRDWELLVHGRSGPLPQHLHIVSRDGRGFRTANGAWIQPYAALNSSRQAEDAEIARCQVWVARHYDTHSPVAGMVEQSGLTELLPRPVPPPRRPHSQPLPQALSRHAGSARVDAGPQWSRTAIC